MKMHELDVLRQHESSAAKDRGIVPDPPFFVRGDGSRLWDQAGAEYLDFCSGSAVANAGHGNPAVAAAIQEQLEKGVLHVGPLFVTEQKARLIEAIVSVMPSDLSRVHLAVTGGEAIEAALKFARVHTGKHNAIGFWGAYHGRTLGALALTAHRSYRDPFFPQTISTAHFPYPYPLRNPFGLSPNDEKGVVAASLNLLDMALAHPASGLSPTAAVVVEPIQGVGGVVVPPPGFLAGLREICDRHGVLLVVDEIFCGFGRTGTWFGFEQEGVIPDLVVVSKGLSGALPISAVVGRDEIMGRLPGGIQSTTFEGNAIPAAAACASIDFLRSVDAPSQARRIGASIESWAEGLAYQAIAETRGRGALWGLEIVDPLTGAPDAERAKEIQRVCLRSGLLLYAGGSYGNVVGIIPPLVATEDELETGLGTLSEVISSVLESSAALTPA